MGIIYKISNTVNDKVYIGQTIQKLIRRWQSHCSDSKTVDTHLYRAMRLYGVDKFFIEAIELNVPDDKLNEREIYWISYYNSYNNGYNSTPGGECGNFTFVPVYQYTLDGDYITMYNGAMEAERITGCLHENILKACKGILRYCGNYLWSFEQFEHLEMRIDKRKKQVDQFNEDHEYIQTWNSVKEAAVSIGVEPTHISRACRTNYKCHNFYWKYHS